jgi:hypothetical protein
MWPTLRRAVLALLLMFGAELVIAAAERAAPGTAGTLLTGPPPAGFYDASLCVSVGTAAATCGPVSVDIGEAGQVLMRISDIAYRLEIYADQLGVTLFHGTMQIDGFFAPFHWSGSQLQFRDLDKGTRYELKVGTRRFDSR